MAFLFSRNRQKGNMDLVKGTKELVLKCLAEEKPQPKTEEELARNLAQMKLVLQEQEVSPDQVLQLIQLLLQEDLLLSLANTIHKLPFESRKDTQVIIATALRFKTNSSTADEPFALNTIISQRPQLIVTLCNGYDRRESAMPCGGVLREALKYDAVAALILYDEPSAGGPPNLSRELNTSAPAKGDGVFWKFFDWIDKSAFEVSADAFNTFREILTRHKQLIATFLEVNFDLFFQKYNRILVQSDSYVTKRQSIKLLGEILLDRANYNIMTAYVASGEHLKIIMKLLLDERKMINYEGFHVFKVFVANPNKTVSVQRMLINNRERLLKFLPGFLSDRKEDDQFMDEKSFLVRQIENLPPQPVPT
ncbi:Mo25-like protein [Patellaria atrata CBS 101060]|uniref:Mo25-like protein n=1 Tax=Patellaria atrata CBS 101060 TaxID=1346257 RepID=A0A9P4S3S2_9PEZI|nr:Mo25-like protein [Patellaria atrata CBS 101060]